MSKWVVDKIAADIEGRRGIGNQWEEIDDDIKN